MNKLQQPIQTIQAFIEKQIEASISNLSPIGTGDWSSTYSYHVTGKDYVIRFSQHSEDFEKDRYATGFSSPQLPVPRITHLGEAFDGYFAISEKAEGIMVDDLTAEQMQRTVPALIALLDALRNVDTSATSGFGGWDGHGQGGFSSWQDYLLDVGREESHARIPGWRDKLAEMGGTQAFDELYHHLTASVATCPEDRHLLHADLLHYNLLIQNHQVSAVIDWGCAKYGDFLYELAWFTFWSPWHASMNGINFRQLAIQHYADIGLSVPNFDERLLCCELHIALDGIAYSAFIEEWDFVKRISQQALALINDKD